MCTPRAHHEPQCFSEKSLAELKQTRRNKVEDFKKKTNYYETRELLERYEDGASAGPSSRPMDSPSSRLQPQQLPVTPQRVVPSVPPNTPANIRTSLSPGLQSQLTRRSLTHLFCSCNASRTLAPFCAETPQQPLPPPRKLWYDKLADALLGEDESPVNAAASRYALICQKCFNHNGLVKEDMWEEARTHGPLLRLLNDADDGHSAGRICLSQVRTFQPICSLPAQRPPITATRSCDADPGTTSATGCIAAGRTAAAKPC
jgi:hypothetical protein